jgi:hypothetical protein
MLRKLTKDEVAEFLWLVTEMKDSAVFANDPILLLADVDDELCAKYSVITGSNNAHL